MKKIIIILAAITAAMLLTACGGGGNASMTTPETTPVVENDYDLESFPSSSELWEILGGDFVTHPFEPVEAGEEGELYVLMASQDASHYEILNGRTVKFSQDGKEMRNAEGISLNLELGEEATLGIYQPNKPFFLYFEEEGDALFCQNDNNEVECVFYEHDPELQPLSGMYAYIPEKGIENILNDIRSGNMPQKMSNSSKLFLR